MDLTCPKCQAPMRSYERSGITVDQCTECRGIFLDRGELERLVDAETAFHAEGRGQPAPPQHQQPQHQQPQHQQSYGGSYGGQPYQQSYGYGHKPHKRRKSFLEELFD